MAATIAASATTFDDTVTSFAATAPSGSTAGQFLVAVSFCDNDGSAAALTASGWTLESSSAGTGPGTADTAGFAKLWSRTSDGSATYTFGTSASAASSVIIARVTGHDTGSPLGGVTPVWSHPTIASATSLIAPTITVPASPASGGDLICFWGQEGAVGGHTITKPVSMTGTSNVDGIPFLVNLMADEHVTAGATGTRTATASNAGNTSTQGYLTLSFFIADEPVADPPGPLVPVLFPSEPLPIRAELDIAGAWADITEYVYQRDGLTIARGRRDEGSEVNPTTLTLTLDNRDGRFSPRNPTGAYYGLIGRNSQIRIALREELGWLQINQATGTTVTTTHVSTPDAAALDITGDLDIRFEADLDSWRDSMDLVGKWTTTGDQRSYRFRLLSSGLLRLSHSTDGTSGGVLEVDSTVPVPITSGRLAVRATLDVSNGGNRVREFFVSDSIDGTWTQLGDTVTTAGTTSVFASTATLHVLDNPNDSGITSLIRGRVLAAAVLNGIGGTEVANPDFTLQDEADTSFSDDAGRTWTLNGDIDLTHYDMRFVGEVTAWPQRWDTTGTDVYTTITASGALRRLLQGSLIGSTLYRGTIRDPDVVAYWPMEDGTNSNVFGSAFPGARDIGISTTTNPASDSTFACSDPLPTIGSSALRAVVLSYPGNGQISVQFLLHVPEALAGDSILATILTGGTAPRWDVLYGTGSGGTLALRAIDADGATIATYGPSGFDVNGNPMLLKVRLSQDGADIDTVLTTYTVGDTAQVAISNTLSTRTINRVTSVTLNPSASADHEGVTIGHLAVTQTTDALYEEIDQVNAWSGELATDRIKRLCEEESVAFCPVGARGDGDSVTLGPQLSDSLINLLRQAANADLGILFEGREFLELRYRPAHALYSQEPDITLDYELHQMQSLEPVEDDQLTRNDVTVSRIGGGSARAEVTAGPLSTDIPPAGVGRYDSSVSVSLENDSTLADQASFRVHLGTVDEARYPRLALALESAHLEDDRVTVHRLDLGDRLSVTGPPAWLAQQDITQLIQGYTETMNAFHHGFVLNLSPASPWDIGVYDDFYAGDRYGNGDCTTTEALDTTETGVDVTTGGDGAPWSTTADGFDIMVGGEQMTVTSVSGTGAAQTLTVTRSVNGVVKSHVSGVAVELFPLSYYGL